MNSRSLPVKVGSGVLAMLQPANAAETKPIPTIARNFISLPRIACAA
ncbi:hypothetical protein K9U39_10745 [Rhodoblastus acidophilus]|uniref:Uncharacterized protein n=1 Tax=Candidatus Rhodoblastus alkanivorans TaxID=2954117 RepID=A0ABS9Z9R5_9HYPH|nr:hypothetical protein [Candidatus Rhodoblastus alkanivorans]MCI4679283.1 hypothetical protein [Candidatus Rhodoblastus alkanivorans]MCI4684090.1 hypothetical protein [Candidatus Rhodoblastus alkanivorans]MDI4641410.1 hypothetical protein [Rhodoblastus acidophilus]